MHFRVILLGMDQAYRYFPEDQCGMRRVWVTAEESEGKSRFIYGKSEIIRLQAWHSGFAYLGGL